MIIKIKSRKNKSYRQLVEYMLHDKERIRPDQDGFVIAHNLRGNHIKGWVKQLEEINAVRVHKRKDAVTMFHEILSWHAEDARHLTPAKMEQMTREYIRQRGASGARILAVPHYNKKHFHVHLLVSGVDSTGKAMSLPRAELAHLQKSIQAYQLTKFPELTKSAVAYGRKSTTVFVNRELEVFLRTGQQTIRNRIRQDIIQCKSMSGSQEEFIARLAEYGLQAYSRGTRLSGVIFASRRYRFNTLGVEIIPMRITTNAEHYIQIKSNMPHVRSKNANIRKSR